MPPSPPGSSCIPHPSTAAVATALAHAILPAPEWTLGALHSAGAQVLGARRRWLGPLAGSVLGAYHRIPADAPRELAAHIAGSQPFAGTVARAAVQRKPLRIDSYVATGPTWSPGRNSAAQPPRPGVAEGAVG